MKKADIGRPSTYLTTVGKLVDRAYVNKDGSSLIPTEHGRLLWIEVVPFYGMDQNSSGTVSEGLFTPRFTALMESSLDKVEEGDTSGAIVWHKFVTDFRNMHNNALELRQQKPTVKQHNLIENRTSRMSEDSKSKLFEGKKIDQLTGEDARRIIEELNNSNEGEIPPSEKQMKYMLSLFENLNLNIDEYLREKGIDDIDSLTGGMDGTASEIIGELVNKVPRTEKQAETIESMSDTLELSMEDAMAMVGTESLDTITKKEASELIGKLKKTIQKNRKGRKK